MFTCKVVLLLLFLFYWKQLSVYYFRKLFGYTFPAIQGLGVDEEDAIWWSGATLLNVAKQILSIVSLLLHTTTK